MFRCLGYSGVFVFRVFRVFKCSGVQVFRVWVLGLNVLGLG